MHSKKSYVLTTITAIGAAWFDSLACGHDFWIELSKYRAEPQETVSVLMRLGDGDEVTPVPRKEDRIKRFRVVGDEIDETIPGESGADPAGSFAMKSPGYYIIALHGSRSSIEIEAPKFHEYLLEEGLEAVIHKRAERGETDAVGREVYSRCAKSIVKVGESSAEKSNFDRRVGLPVEITPLTNPFELNVGDTIDLIVEYESKPLVGALIEAVHRNAENKIDATISLRTNIQGKASFPLKHAGVWLFACTHMVEAPDGADADWESFWGALTIEVAAAEAKQDAETAADERP